MRRSTTSSVFPDINVWLALTSERHVHHQVAHHWFDDAGSDLRLFFCRHTQLGLLRLLSTEAVMGAETMTQLGAWETYDRWLLDDRVEFLNEPSGLENRFRMAARLRRPAPKDWADSYLVAFAEAAQLTLVTFDRALRAKSKSAVLLSE